MPCCKFLALYANTAEFLHSHEIEQLIVMVKVCCNVYTKQFNNHIKVSEQ